MKKKTTRRTTRTDIISIIAIILTISIIIIALVFITPKSKETFWDKPNELRVAMEFNIIEDDEKAKTVLNQETQIFGTVDGELKGRIDNLKLGMISFFKEEYQIDVSQKLAEMQEINLFIGEEYNGGVLDGYTDTTDMSIYLNKDLLEKTAGKFDSVFIHEAIHYLGMVDSNSEGMYIVEGVTEALTQQCCEFMDLAVVTDTYYEFQKELALQILIVDKDIVRNVFSGTENVFQRINNVLKDVPRRFNECEKPSETLECCISSLFFDTAGQGAYVIIFLAQDIVASYCKTFEPTEQQIKEIREHYVFEDFENMDIFKEGDIVYLDYN